MLAAVLDDLGFGSLRRPSQNDYRLYRLTPFLVRHADDRHLENSGVCADNFLDLTRVDVCTTGDDHVLLAIRDVQVAIFVKMTHVAGMEPAVAERLRGRVGVVPVTLHHEVATYDDLPRRSRRNITVHVVDHPDLDPGGLASSRAEAAPPDWIIAGEMIALGQDRADHWRLALSKDLAKDRPERPHRLLLLIDVHRGAAIENGMEA